MIRLNKILNENTVDAVDKRIASEVNAYARVQLKIPIIVDDKLINKLRTASVSQNEEIVLNKHDLLKNNIDSLGLFFKQAAVTAELRVNGITDNWLVHITLRLTYVTRDGKRGSTWVQHTYDEARKQWKSRP